MLIMCTSSPDESREASQIGPGQSDRKQVAPPLVHDVRSSTVYLAVFINLEKSRQGRGGALAREGSRSEVLALRRGVTGLGRMGVCFEQMTTFNLVFQLPVVCGRGDFPPGDNRS